MFKMTLLFPLITCKSCKFTLKKKLCISTWISKCTLCQCLFTWRFYSVTLLGGQDDYDILVSGLFSIIRSEKKTKTKTSTTPSCSGPIPAQKSRGNSVLGVIFSHTIPKMDFHYSHRFS